MAVSVAINYFTTAIMFSLMERTSIWNTIAQNVGFTTLFATLVLNFAGGILLLLLHAKPFPVGYIIAPGLFGFVLAVRGQAVAGQKRVLSARSRQGFERGQPVYRRQWADRVHAGMKVER